jgi:hypothetical protein
MPGTCPSCYFGHNAYINLSTISGHPTCQRSLRMLQAVLIFGDNNENLFWLWQLLDICSCTRIMFRISTSSSIWLSIKCSCSTTNGLHHVRSFVDGGYIFQLSKGARQFKLVNIKFGLRHLSHGLLLSLFSAPLVTALRFPKLNTSPIFSLPANSITSLSMPHPQPPVGGRPHSNALK